MKIEKVRKFLTENKIFFEVIVATLVSFMAIYVSIQANRIAENQTWIMQEENYPQLEIRSTQEYNEKLRIYDNEIWLFFNRGGKLSDFNIKKYSFYKFVFQPSSDQISLPLIDYINMIGFATGDNEGLVYQIDNNHQGNKEIELRDSLQNFGYYEIENYVAVFYQDIFNEQHEEYFQISPGIKKIEKKKWDLIKESHIKGKDRYSFSNLSAKKIIEMKNNSRLSNRLP